MDGRQFTTYYVTAIYPYSSHVVLSVSSREMENFSFFLFPISSRAKSIRGPATASGVYLFVEKGSHL